MPRSGSRPPGVFGRPQSIYQLSGFDVEKLTSHEAGLKSEFLDHRLRVNLAAYYSDYSKHLTYLNQFECLGQRSRRKHPSTCRRSARRAAPSPGASTSRRRTRRRVSKLEVTAEPIPDLLVNLNAGYNDYDVGAKTPGAPGYVFPGNLPQLKENASIGAQYGIHLPAGTLTPRLDANYQSKQTFNPATATPHRGGSTPSPR